jgi:hypothetical protein
LVRYIDNLGRKGCCRTSLELTKFFLSLDPEKDPFGNLLKIDFYALRSNEYKYISTFAQRYTEEFHNYPLKTILFTPNLLLSTAIAKFKLSDKVDNRTMILDDAHSSINTFVSLISDKACEESPKILQSLYALGAEALLMLGLVFYPTLIKLILVKVEADKKPNYTKSYFKDNQNDPWAKILDHKIFEFDEDDEVLEHSLGLDSDDLSKYFDLYVDRTSECYKDDDILAWLKESIGYVLNEVDTDNFDREVLFQFIFNSVGLPFELKRYAKLSKEFFNDDFTTVNQEELMGQPANGGMGGMNAPNGGMGGMNAANRDMGGMNAANGGMNAANGGMNAALGGMGGLNGMNAANLNPNVQANLEEMLRNRNVPAPVIHMPVPQPQVVPQNRALPPVDVDNLILEDPEAIREQELIMQHIANQNKPQFEEEEFIITDAGDDEVRKENNE